MPTPSLNEVALENAITHVLRDRIPQARGTQLIGAARAVMHIPRIKDALFGLAQRESMMAPKPDSSNAR